MLVQKLKGFKFRILKKESNELESYTLIHLNEYEEQAFLKEAGLKKEDIGKSLIINYDSINSPLYTLFTKFADEHKIYKDNFKSNLNIDYKYTTNITEGKWYLRRDVRFHTIFLNFRKDTDEYNDLNHICISNVRASQFCTDCLSHAHRKPNNKKYLSSCKDGDVYTYWSNYMNEKYLKDKYKSV